MKIEEILLVDDEADIRQVARFALTHLGGWSVREAGGGQEALRAIRERRPDVVLLDVMMPGMDGVQTLGALRVDPQLAGVPVLFMTARVGREDLDSYLQAGAQGVIRKPFDPLSLAGEIQRLVGGA